MKYENIKKAKLSHKQIAKAMGYSNVNSFRSSSAHKRIMSGLDELMGMVNITPKMDCDIKIKEVYIVDPKTTKGKSFIKYFDDQLEVERNKIRLQS
jgi:hypothetical protein